MSTTYLFRIDGAKENDDFFAAMVQSANHVYAGVELRVGSVGWIPDLLKVVVDEPPDRCSLTLIELEATEPAALISCRKYLPESSAGVLSAFSDYLDRVIRQCRSSADRRESEFAKLKSILSESRQTTIRTAGALRSSTVVVEELPLIDQPERAAQPRAIRKVEQGPARVFQGVLRLSAREGKGFARSVMILDAVIRRRDHSSATLHAWRGRAPLKGVLREKTQDYSAIRKAVLESQHGATLDFEGVLSDLVRIWSEARGQTFDPEQIRRLINCYFPVALTIRRDQHMTGVFEMARKHLAETATGKVCGLGSQDCGVGQT